MMSRSYQCEAVDVVEFALLRRHHLLEVAVLAQLLLDDVNRVADVTLAERALAEAEPRF